jgi:cyclomaltodextrinase / maltogenic alpha-amylase / neopullulanase
MEPGILLMLMSNSRRIYMKSNLFSRIIIGCLALAALLCQPSARAENLSQIPARTSPAWLRDGVVYEIFPRVFSSTGDLNGITAQLDRLKDLGVTILWTMPIHPIGEELRKGEFGSPYAIRDYYAVDPNYGTVDDYRRLVSEAHKRGLKVIMDLVADHTAWDAVMMKHPEFYKHDAQGKVIPPVPEWTDVAALNYGSPALRRYMIAMIKYWIQTCDVDGFRCDAASMVPTAFWEQVRTELTKVKPDIMMLAEASKPELLVKAFDIDYSWPLLATMNDVLIHNAPASNIRRSWEKSHAEFPKDALNMRISDDHDENRAVTRYGLSGALAASALMFTLDGVPLIYNGMEVGDATESGGAALFDKRPVSWLPNDHPSLREIYHDLIQLRHQYAALRNSRVDWLHNSDETRLLTFLRADDKDELLVVINFSNRPLTGKVNLKNAAGFVPVEISGAQSSDGVLLPVFHLNGFEWHIYHRAAISLHPVPGVAAKEN